MRRIYGVVIVYFICAAFCFVSLGFIRALGVRHTNGAEFKYILDAGHGLPDGGAVGVDGTTEQELNLKLVLKIQEALKNKNVSVLLTRADENGIFTEGNTIHNKKVSDIRNRVNLSKQYSDIPVVSIHMNSFADRSVCGIQVFYKKDDEASMRLAQKMQNNINTVLQPQNGKVSKPIPSNVYLFSHIPNSCILIECGFVTNEEELAKLKDDAYLQKVSNVITEVLTADY